MALHHGPATAQATLDPEEFARSERVFVGRVVEQESFPSEDGRLILTRIRFEVHTTLKGERLPAAEMIEYGGRLGEKWLRVTHGPSYRSGGEYLVFADRDEQGRLRTLGGWQGQLPVLRDGRGGAVVRIFSQHPVAASFFPDLGSDLLPLEVVAERLAGRLRRSP